MSINFKLIGRQIKSARKLNKMSQAVLAERIDMSVPYISHIETAKKQLSVTTLVLIANALNVTADSLLIGNQVNDHAQHSFEFAKLINDCNSAEKRFIYEMAVAAKNSLQKNSWLQTSSD